MVPRSCQQRTDIWQRYKKLPLYFSFVSPIVLLFLVFWDTETKQQRKHGGFRPVPVTTNALGPVLRTLKPVWLHLETKRPKDKNPSANPKCPLTAEAAKKRKEDAFYVGKYQERFLAQMKAMYEYSPGNGDDFSAQSLKQFLFAVSKSQFVSFKCVLVA
eukprot:jgi/Bigna1/81604/fgenesh1_pg.82_\